MGTCLHWIRYCLVHALASARETGLCRRCARRRCLSGGERPSGRARRRSENEVAFIIAIDMVDGRPRGVCLDLMRGFSFGARRYGRKAQSPNSYVFSNGVLGFEVPERLGCEYKVIPTTNGKAGTEIAPFKWLNGLFGNLKLFCPDASRRQVH
jgi:hypothetical protein